MAIIPSVTIDPQGIRVIGIAAGTRSGIYRRRAECFGSSRAGDVQSWRRQSALLSAECRMSVSSILVSGAHWHGVTWNDDESCSRSMTNRRLAGIWARYCPRRILETAVLHVLRLAGRPARYAQPTLADRVRSPSAASTTTLLEQSDRTADSWRPSVFLGGIAARQAVASALDVILGGLGGGGAWAIPPGIVSSENCNPQLNPLLPARPAGVRGCRRSTDQHDSAGHGHRSSRDAAGDDWQMRRPLTFYATALGNLGLINGQSGNDGYTPQQAAQMVSTIATFDQVEADLAGILATASGEGASLGITGDIALLQTSGQPGSRRSRPPRTCCLAAMPTGWTRTSRPRSSNG